MMSNPLYYKIVSKALFISINNRNINGIYYHLEIYYMYTVYYNIHAQYVLFTEYVNHHTHS